MAFNASPFVLASTARCLSCCTTLMPLLSARVSEPLEPLTVTASTPIVTVTPCGRSTGFFATRDIVKTLICRLLDLLNDEENFAAGAGSPRLLVGHDALRRRYHRHTQTAQHLGQLVLAAIDPQARPADALDSVDDRPAVVILQFDGQRALGARHLDVIGTDIAFFLQDLENGQLQLRRAHAHRGLTRGLRVADAGQKIGDGISHAHCARLTSWPLTGPEFPHDWPPRAVWCAPIQTCGTRRANVRLWNSGCAAGSPPHRAAAA